MWRAHSQMIRPMRWETMRYGAVSELADSQYDHPFQWGSKRTGPDLAREGGRYPHLWHYRHMMDPRSITPGSNMPEYRHLASDTVDWASLSDHVRALRSIGVPYSASDVEGAPQDAEVQAQAITQELKKEGVEVAANSEMVALIAYLQRLGKPQSEVAVVDPTSPATARSASLSRSQLNP
jgi:cytochrome c oxidase cbb3-type subunit I/II